MGCSSRKKANRGEAGLMRASGKIYRISVLLCAAATAASLFSTILASAIPQTGWTLDNILKQMDAQAANFHSLTADLERTKVTVVVNDKSTESGQILVRSDSKMRIDVTQPDARTILRDGDNFYIYNPKIHRVEEYNLGKKKSVVDQFLLLGFGTSGSSLKESYTVTLQGEETLDNRKVLRLELLPKTEEVRKQLSKINCGWTNPHGFRSSSNSLRRARAITSSSGTGTSIGTCASRITSSNLTGRTAQRECNLKGSVPRLPSQSCTHPAAAPLPAVGVGAT